MTNFDLERFVEAQNDQILNIELELLDGEKRTHWIWYVFPQPEGLGKSPESWYYGLAPGEVEAYLNYSLLSQRLLRWVRLMIDAAEAGLMPADILGELDALKFRTSMETFAEVSDNPIFQEALELVRD